MQRRAILKEGRWVFDEDEGGDYELVLEEEADPFAETENESETETTEQEYRFDSGVQPADAESNLLKRFSDEEVLLSKDSSPTEDIFPSSSAEEEFEEESKEEKDDDDVAVNGSVVEKKEVKLPWKVLWIVYGVLMSDAFIATIIVPFIPGLRFSFLILIMELINSVCDL